MCVCVYGWIFINNSKLAENVIQCHNVVTEDVYMPQTSMHLV